MNPRPDVKPTGEAAFETVIEAHLLAHGCVAAPGAGFDRERAVFPDTALAFVRETQPREWARLEALLGAGVGAQVLADLCKWMDAHGALATLRHGFKRHGRTLRIAFFRPAHGLNPELDARYAANRVGVTRQLRFSPRSEQSLDVVLSVNGVPVTVVVVTDRVVLDQQLQDAIYQFEHKRGVVRKIDGGSRQLAEALEQAVPIVVTTLQKFPFVSRQLLRLAEERGAVGTGVLPTRRCAVVVDEAHSCAGRRGGGRTEGAARRRGVARRGAAARGRGGPRRPGGAVRRPGEAGPAGEPELLRLHGDAQAPDAEGVRPRRAARAPLHDAAGDRGRVHPRRAAALHVVRRLLPAPEGVRRRPARGAEEGGPRARALPAAASAQRRAEDGSDGRAFPGRHPPPDRRARQGDGGHRLPPRGGPLQAELRPLRPREGLRHPLAGGVLGRGGGRSAAGRHLH